MVQILHAIFSLSAFLSFQFVIFCKNFGLIVTYEYRFPAPKSSVFAYSVAFFHVYICKIGSLPPAAGQVFGAEIIQLAQTSDANVVIFICSDLQGGSTLDLEDSCFSQMCR